MMMKMHHRIGQNSIRNIDTYASKEPVSPTTNAGRIDPIPAASGSQKHRAKNPAKSTSMIFSRPQVAGVVELDQPEWLA
jgi:hypothetical protein